MESRVISGRTVRIHRYNTVIVGAGAAGMNCAVHLYEFMERRAVERPGERIALVTGGLGLGASRMSGSDKQTYYKLGTSPDAADSAEAFAATLTAAGCCHGDLALAEGLGSLREFYHLVQAGVPFPTDAMGSFVGYRTDHDAPRETRDDGRRTTDEQESTGAQEHKASGVRPQASASTQYAMRETSDDRRNTQYERATSAGPKTSRFMAEALQRQVQRYGIEIFDRQEVVELLVVGQGQDRRIVGVATIDNKGIRAQEHKGTRLQASGETPATRSTGILPVSDRGEAPSPHGDYELTVFLADNVVLAAGGPGEMYQTSVYPRGQLGIHGLAFRAGLAAENLTESQFGLASTKFRWNVSGTYMQAIPRIFSTDAAGRDEREFLAEFFDSMRRMATATFLKGYQWPFDPQRIAGHGSSLIDILVFNETQRGRRVFLDFRRNPVAQGNMQQFSLEDLEPEAAEYLKRAGALQALPIERLAHMNPLAIEIYCENGIDLHTEPLEIAVCAQHNNGGFAVNKWWESNIPHTFVIGEMAGTHGVKRPGGSALNAGQVGGLRAAEYIANAYGSQVAQYGAGVDEAIEAVVARLDGLAASTGLVAGQVVAEIQGRMTAEGGHVRRLDGARQSLAGAFGLYKRIGRAGFAVDGPKALLRAVQAEHLALCSVAYLKAIVALLEAGGGSRGSYLVLDEGGMEIHPAVLDAATGKPMRFRPENERLRACVLRVWYDPAKPDLFGCVETPVRPIPTGRKAFEPAWEDYRQGRIYG